MPNFGRAHQWDLNLNTLLNILEKRDFFKYPFVDKKLICQVYQTKYVR